MKKKIKELSMLEINKICAEHPDCKNCPLDFCAMNKNSHKKLNLEKEIEVE